MSEEQVSNTEQVASAENTEAVAQVQTGEDAKAPAEVVVPEKYEFKLPEGFESFDSDLLSQFEAKAKSLKLTQEAAQEFVDLYAGRLASYQKQAEETRAKNIERWESEAKADKEFGGEAFEVNLNKAKRAVENPKLVAPQFKALLDETGLGSHPEVMRHFLRLHNQFMAEGDFHSGQPTVSRGNSLEERAARFYPQMMQKEA